MTDGAYAESIMQGVLKERGFDFDEPSVGPAWASFLQFAAMELPGPRTTSVGVELLQYADRDDTLWLSLMRRFEDEDGGGFSCGCLLSRDAPASLMGVGTSQWWWPEDRTFAQWIIDVEAMPEFQQARVLEGWKWEGFSE